MPCSAFPLRVSPALLWIERPHGKNKTHVMNLKRPGEDRGSGEFRGIVLVWAKWPCYLQVPKLKQHLQDICGQFMFPGELAGKVFQIFYHLKYQTEPEQKHFSLWCQARLCNPSRLVYWIEWQLRAEEPCWDSWPPTAGYSSRALQLQAW